MKHGNDDGGIILFSCCCSELYSKSFLTVNPFSILCAAMHKTSVTHSNILFSTRCVKFVLIFRISIGPHT